MCVIENFIQTLIIYCFKIISIKLINSYRSYIKSVKFRFKYLLNLIIEVVYLSTIFYIVVIN